MNQDPAWRIQQALLEQAGLDVEAITDVTAANLESAARDTVESLQPTEVYMVVVPLAFSTITAFATALIISLAVIPSATSTILKYRSGVIDLMHEEEQLLLKKTSDYPSLLRGAMFWGTLVSALLMALIVGGIVFFILWQVSASLAQKTIAAIIGVALVALLHWGLVSSCRKPTSKAFYRKRVAAYNITLHMRECASFALSITFSLVRLAKVVLTTTFLLGRVDIPFLAPGVGELGRLKLDRTPHIFVLDLLQHDAHRHPYIDMFGTMCLLKLRAGDAFVTRAGSAWRLLFILTLMPWLTRFRRMAHMRATKAISVQSFNSQELSDENKDDTIERLQAEIQWLKEQLQAMDQKPNKPVFSDEVEL